MPVPLPSVRPWSRFWYGRSTFPHGCASLLGFPFRIVLFDAVVCAQMPAAQPFASVRLALDFLTARTVAIQVVHCPSVSGKFAWFPLSLCTPFRLR